MKKLMIGLLFFCGISKAQIILPLRPTSPGLHVNIIKPDSASMIPSKLGLMRNTTDTGTQIFLNKQDSALWYWSMTTGYRKVGTGSSTNASADSLSYNWDRTRILKWRNGILQGDSINLYRDNLYVYGALARDTARGTDAQGIIIEVNNPYKEIIDSLRSLSFPKKSRLYQSTDYGYGNWVVDILDDSTADDNGSVLVTTDGTRLKRPINNDVYLEWFGTDSTAIANAMAATPNNGTLHFKAGFTYNISGKINILHPIKIDGNRAVINRTTANGTAISIQSSNVTIDGLEVRGPGNATYNSGGKLIITEGSSQTNFYGNLAIRDCKIHNNTYGAIQLSFVSNVTIERDSIYDFPYEAVLLLSCWDSRIRDNYISNIHGTGTPSLNAYGIALSSNLITDTTYISKNVLVEGNHIKDIPTWEGLDTHGGHNINFRNNIVENCKSGIVVGNYNLGGVLSVPRDIIVDNNTVNLEPFVATGRYAIVFASADTSLAVASANITNNKMYGAGMELITARSVNIDNNKIFRSTNGIGIYVLGTSTGINITHNYFEDIYSTISSTTAAILVANTDTLEGYIGGNTLRRTSFTNPYGFTVNAFGIYIFSSGSNIIYSENDFSGASTQPKRYGGVIEQPVRMQISGDPTGVIQLPIGSQVTRIDGASATTLYLKEGSLIGDWAALSTPLNTLAGPGLTTQVVPYVSAANTLSNSTIYQQPSVDGINVNRASIGRSGTGYAFMGDNISYTGTNDSYTHRFTGFSAGWSFARGGAIFYAGDSAVQGAAVVPTKPFSILNNGMVGIGLLAPLQALHVHGKVQIDTLSNGSSSDSLLTVSNGVIRKVLNSTALINEVTNLYFTNSRAIGSTLTGYTSGAGTVSSSDNILQAIQKINGNVAALSAGSGASLSSSNIFTTNGAVSTPAEQYNGTWYSGGTATTTKPFFHIEPTGATSAAWSTSGTGLGVNAPSGFTGNVADFQLNGSSILKITTAGGAGYVNITGLMSLSGTFQTNPTNTASNVYFNGASGSGLSAATSTSIFTMGGRNFQSRSLFGGTSSTVATAGNDIANAIFGAAAQTEATSGTHALVSNVLIKTPVITNGTATTTDMQALYVDDAPSGGTNNYSINAGKTIFRDIVILKGYTVATLPTGITGATAYVTDATAPTYNGALTGGGAVTVPVFYNGSAWVSH